MTPTWKSDCGTVELYLGDCLEVMPELSRVDCVVTDPPYGKKDTHSKHLSKIILRNGEPAGRALQFEGISGDQLVSLASKWVEMANRWVVFTCEWKQAHLLDEVGILVRLGIWRKRNGAPQFTGDRPGMGWEAVAICHRPGKKRWNGGGHHAFWDVPKINGYGHPTTKPLPLAEDFANKFSDKGEIILDPFMGSGTTGVACVRTRRKFVGIEIDPKYFEIAKQRIQKELSEAQCLIPQLT